MEPIPDRYFPKVPFNRRIGAFVLDLCVTWFLSAFGGQNGVLQFLIFTLIWLGMRVLVADQNQGQSLGRWAFDAKVIDARFHRTPEITRLAKREGILAIEAFFTLLGLQQLLRNSLLALLLLAPLLIDCGLAFADEALNQAFHDRVADTLVIQTQRGFSLDLRLKQWKQLLLRRFRP